MAMVKRRLTVLTLVGVLLVLAVLPPSLVPVGTARAEGVSLAELSGTAVGLLRQDFQTNGARNGDMGVGTFAFYTLETAKIDTSGWSHADISLEDAVTAQVIQDINRPENVSAKVLAQDLLAMKVIQRTDLADQVLKILQARQKDTGFDENIFSNLSAYDLLGRGGYLDAMGAARVRGYLLSQKKQGPDGGFYGWGSYPWKGKVDPGIMSTCEAIRALSALDPQKSDAEVQEAIRQGLTLLQRYQLSDGSFLAGMDDPAIDTAEVIITLKKLGLKPDVWVSSSGKTAVDYMTEKVLNPDGSLGACQNIMDATWVLDACASLNSPAAVPALRSGFKDIQGHWAEREILVMSGLGYVSGVGDQFFAPDSSVTRAQFATLLVKSLGIDPVMPVSSPFTDVPQSHWACPMINAAYQKGLISGVGSGIFAPDQRITREEMAVIVSNALKANGSDIGITQEQTKEIMDRYTDAGQVSGWAEESVAACIDKGLFVFNGRSAGQLAGREYASRAETVVVLERMLKYLDRLQ
ncbi:MAG: hypothetical protein HPY50_03190 [Firmicutes bacterium]|nr:hypothetical protein [Bacillota bacterium]